MISTPSINNKLEMNLARISTFATFILFGMLYVALGRYGYDYYQHNNYVLVAETAGFGACMFFMAYGNMLYHICLIGYYKRRQAHVPATREELNRFYMQPSPSLSVIIPSYKEELEVVWQTMMSAALSEYPQKNVVLLIDDPYRPNSLEDIVKLEATRNLIGKIQDSFAEPLALYNQEKEGFLARKAEHNLHYAIELNRLSILYDEVADWLEKINATFTRLESGEKLPYNKQFFSDAILLAPANAHRALATQLREQISKDEAMDIVFLETHYNRIAALFNVNFSSFERKRYVNLSHEANKAMNLNCYISLVGKSWKEVQTVKGLELHETTASQADFTIPAADYIDTIDADTVMLSEYALRVIHLMETNGNEKMAVVQSPCSTIPNSPNSLERVAGACIDIQFQTHIGYTDWNATSWVGANAMLRYKALEEIKEIHEEGDKRVAVYIQDRTVIEDTESTIDLVEKGWKLYNYPERMTFSPTPPDFGSLLIQRRRWANGGMIILPKLFSYMRKSRFNLALAKEFFMRFHYLSSTTTTCIAAATMLLYPFGEVSGIGWITLSTLPCLMLYSRDLRNCGYKYSDSIRICALTIMLFPIMIGGILKQFQQMITGKKIPFGRTPKVSGRTAAPALYCLIELALLSYCSYYTVHHMVNLEFSQALLSAINAGFMLYALVHYMGIKATLEDVFAVFIRSWKQMFHQVEIIPLAAFRKTRAYLGQVRRQA